MTGGNSFVTLCSRMTPEAQERARIKSEELEAEMTIAEVERGGLKKFATVDELFADLHADD